MKSVCFIGHKEIERKEELKNKLIHVIKKLINDYDITNFLFGDKSDFNNLCVDIVSNLKNEYKSIKLIYYPSNDWYRDNEEENNKFFENIFNIHKIRYDKYIYLNYYGKSGYVRRNKKMIDDSDICVFYYNINYVPKKTKWLKLNVSRKSGTMIAYNYAKLKHKAIINLFEWNNYQKEKTGKKILKNCKNWVKMRLFFKKC